MCVNRRLRIPRQWASGMSNVNDASMRAVRSKCSQKWIVLCRSPYSSISVIVANHESYLEVIDSVLGMHMHTRVDCTCAATGTVVVELLPVSYENSAFSFRMPQSPAVPQCPSVCIMYCTCFFMLIQREAPANDGFKPDQKKVVVQ